MATASNLKIETKTITEIVDNLGTDFDLPEFQRTYVWKVKQVHDLLDSIYRNYPIGSILLWEAPPERSMTQQGKIREECCKFIIDGQQRIRSLWKIKNGELACFFTKDRKFEVSSEHKPHARKENDEIVEDAAMTEENKKYTSVAAIWNKEWSNGISKEEETLYSFLERRLNSYKVPVVTLRCPDIETAEEVFERVNRAGTKLQRNDLEAAKAAIKHSGFVANSVRPFFRELKQHGFDRLQQSHLFRITRFFISPEDKSNKTLYDTDAAEVEKGWQQTEKMVRKTMKFFHNEFGLSDMKLGWSVNLMIPAIALFHRWEIKGEEPDTDGLAAWIALAAVHHRYARSSNGKVEEDLMTVRRESNPIRTLLMNMKKTGISAKWDKYIPLTDAGNFDGNVQDKGLLFAAYIACRHKGMFDFISTLSDKDSKPVPLKNFAGIDKHHIMPAKYAKEYTESPWGNPRRDFDTIANIAFISSSTNRKIGDDSPDIYLKALSPKVRESQCIPSDEKYFSLEQRQTFWNVRRENLSRAFNEYIECKLHRR